MIKLVIEDRGDMSVGLFPQSWEIETPFHDLEMGVMIWFADEMMKVYSEFCNGKTTYSYIKDTEVIREFIELQK